MPRPRAALLLFKIFVYYICQRQAETLEGIAREDGVGVVGKWAWITPSFSVPFSGPEDPEKGLQIALCLGTASASFLQPPKTQLFIDSYKWPMSASPLPTPRGCVGASRSTKGG